MGSFLQTNAYVHVEALENREKGPRVVLPPREERELEMHVVPVAQVMGDASGRRISETPGPSGPSTSTPKSLSSSNFTSAEGKKILQDLRKPDEVLGVVVD
ncbi:hypothetical protein Pyn_25696 [Prunus yedoensis var. nudiflora]|uniref:Uncharacterized protein n=1 Tax=Prunus yedoensis var. nudiflora TaxID=2094558 RepID=A0A314Z0R2_PRUYE|nr:hypothetical protein Pyn_25696 [Prunus yedoensis var. nudiflora]